MSEKGLRSEARGIPTILTLVGSLRDGFNAALARSATHMLDERASVARFDRLEQLPHYFEGLDVEDHAYPVIADFRRAVRDADGLLLVTPEYNGGPSSLIKNALDTASRPREAAPIAGKPVAVIGATPSPGQTAQARGALMQAIPRAGGLAVEPTAGLGRAHRSMTSDGYDQDALANIAPTLEALLVAAGRAAAGRDRAPRGASQSGRA